MENNDAVQAAAAFPTKMLCAGQRAVVLDGVLRDSYNRFSQRWHLLWLQPVLSRSWRQV